MDQDSHGSAGGPTSADGDRSSGRRATPRDEQGDEERLAAWLEPQEVLLDVRGRECAQVLKAAAATIGLRCNLQPTPVFDALWRREQAGSTALGKGFAIPHARIAGIDRPMTFYVRSAFPLDLAAPDGRPVRDLLVILVPNEGDADDHLRLLALVARLACDALLRDAMRDGIDPATIASAFRLAIARVR